MTIRPTTASAVTTSTLDSQPRYRLVTPTSGELETFRLAVRLARRLGLVFEPGHVWVNWTNDPITSHDGTLCRGMTDTGRRPVRIYLRRGHADLLTVLHELHHAHDAYHHPGLIRAEDEFRAEQFVHRACEFLEAMVPTRERAR